MTLDKHRIPGSVDKHLPDFRGDSVDVEELLNASDGQAWETLSEIGYEKGDWLILRNEKVDPGKTSTSSTSYVPMGGRGETLLVDWDDLPSGATYGIRVYGQPDSPDLEAAPMETDKFYQVGTVFTNAEFEATTNDFTVGPYHEFETKPSGLKGYGLAIRSADGTSYALWWGAMELAVKI